MINVQIELTASPSLLDAMLKLALAFQGQAAAVPQSTEEVKPAKTKKVQETVKTEKAPETEAVHNAAEAVAQAADAVAQAAEAVAQTIEATQKAGSNTITVEDLRAIVRDKAQAGKREQIKAILTGMDSTSVTTLKEEQYADFLTKVKAL